MDIAESIYDDSLEPSYKKPTIEDYNLAVQSSKNRGESALSKTHYVMDESAGMRRK